MSCACSGQVRLGGGEEGGREGGRREGGRGGGGREGGEGGREEGSCLL